MSGQAPVAAGKCVGMSPPPELPPVPLVDVEVVVDVVEPPEPAPPPDELDPPVEWVLSAPDEHPIAAQETKTPTIESERLVFISSSGCGAPYHIHGLVREHLATFPGMRQM